MNVRDWRDVDPRVTRRLYDRAARRWSTALGWDTANNWQVIEQARTTWGLPGLLAVDARGEVRGWLYFLAHDSRLQVGGLVADTPRATTALLEALVGAGEDLGAHGISCFLFEEAPAVAEALRHHGFAVEPFLYLSRAVTSSRPPESDRAVEVIVRSQDRACRPGEGGDLRALARLLYDAYAPDAARYLVRQHSVAGWEQYVRSVVDQTGLGRFEPDLTRVIEDETGVGAAVLVTALSAATIHVAQVAVAPACRGQRLAERLIREVMQRGAVRGFAALTLLVGASNGAARHVYEQLGFEARARFLAAMRG